MPTPRVHRGGYVLQVSLLVVAFSLFFFDALCRKGDVFNYAVSVPYRKVRANEEVLLAWEMNGKPLPKIHGAPLRVVVAGYIGARSCKWVYQINALAEASLGPVQAQEYLYYTSQVRYNLDVQSIGYVMPLRLFRSANRIQSIPMGSRSSRCLFRLYLVSVELC